MKKTCKRGLRVLYAAALLLTANSLSAQGPKWSGPAALQAYDSNNQEMNSVAVDGSGNSYTAGFFNGSTIDFYGWATTLNNAGASTTYDGFLSKHDRASGNVIWAVTMGGTSNDFTTGVTVYPQGSDYVIYVCGHFNSTMTFNSTDGTTVKSITAVGGQDAYIAKYSSSGIVQWAYDIGSSTNDAGYGIVATTNHSTSSVAIYLCGAYGSNITFSGQSANLTKNLMFSTIPNDAYLVRYIDDIGNNNVYADWARGLGCSGTGAGTDSYYSVGADASGDVVVTGFMGSGLSGGTYDIDASTTANFAANGSSEAVAISYNSSGTEIWAGHYGGAATSPAVTDAGLSATMDLNGNAYLGGYFSGTGTFGSGFTGYVSQGAQDSYVICVSPTGTTQWVQTGGTTNGDDMIGSLAVDNCGKHVYAGGQYRGSFSFAGFSFNPYNTGVPDIDGMFMTLDASNGNGISGDGTRMGGSDGIDNRTAVAVNALEDVYVSGTFASTYWYLGSSNTLTNFDNPTTGHFDSYLYRWDNSNFPASVSAGHAGHNGVGVDDCTIYAGGEMWGSNVTFGSTTLSSTQYSPGVYTMDVYLTSADKYGNYTSFTKVVNGTSGETMDDQFTDASGNNYLCGSAITGISSPGNLSFNNGSSVTINNSTWGWVCKTNSSAAVQWANWISNTGAGSSEVTGVTSDNSGNVYACGTFSGSVTFTDPAGSPISVTSSGGGVNSFVAKYGTTSPGNLLWVKTFAATSGGINAFGITTLGSDYYVTGAFTGSVTIGANNLTASGGTDIFVMRGATSNGTATCSEKYSTSNADHATDVVASATNAVYVGGAAGVNAFLGKADLSTTTPSWPWTRASSGATIATDFRVAYQNGFAFLAGTNSSGTLTFGSLSCGTGAFVVRYDASGTEQCINVYTGYYTYGLINESGMLNNDGGDDIILAGGLPDATTGSNSASAYIHTMGLSNCIFSERHAMTDPNGFIDNQNKPSDNGLFTSSIYPNPTDGSATLELSGNYDLNKNPGTLVIIDMTGRVVKQVNNIATPLTTIDISEMANGIYQYQFVSNGQIISLGKVVVQH